MISFRLEASEVSIAREVAVRTILPGRRALLLAAINWVPKPPACPADITGDGLVTVEDLLVVLSGWGGTGAADINGDGIVDVMDLLGVVAAWGECE